MTGDYEVEGIDYPSIIDEPNNVDVNKGVEVDDDNNEENFQVVEDELK
jgi:hypothetical protein